MTESNNTDITRTLPDLLTPDLNLVFVGLNPSEYSARDGHYFANPRNRFWPAFNQSALLPLTMDRPCAPSDDAALLQHGIGFTDVVKRPTPQANGLKAADYRRWAPLLREKLLQCRPRLICFHGLTAYKAYLRYAENDKSAPTLGQQPRTIGDSTIFVVPNPSPANARYSVADLAYWYNKLAAVLPNQATNCPESAATARTSAPEKG